MGSQPRNIAEQKQYHDFLDNMNEERSRRNALGKMKDFQEGKKVRKLLYNHNKEKIVQSCVCPSPKFG